MNAKAIPERMTNIRKNLFLIARYVKDNKDIKTVMKGKYCNE
jgi:cystathionine beta-lyase/cystathionine gamma-synthase